jgi:hypothetical protein
MKISRQGYHSGVQVTIMDIVNPDKFPGVFMLTVLLLLIFDWHVSIMGGRWSLNNPLKINPLRGSNLWCSKSSTFSAPDNQTVISR